MFLKILRAKIHRATITQAEVDYVGSITIDRDLIDAAGLVVGECVLVADFANGARFETYVIEGERRSGTICINGAAATLVDIGDLIIIVSFAYMTPEEARQFTPTVLLMGEGNCIDKIIS